MTIFGLTLFTWFHVLLSLAMLVAGFVVAKDLLHSRIATSWMAIFLVTGVLTSATGFGFPFTRFIESHYVGLVSLVVLAAAILGLYVFRLAGPWRWIFAISVLAAFYFDALVAIAQLFRKVPALGAPTATTELPFVAAQVVLLAIFIWLGFATVKRFQPAE
jgi:hypothetical protein